MMRAVPWQTGEICGPESAKSLTKAEQLKRDWTKAKRPLLIVGAEAVEEKYLKGDMVDFAIALSEAGKIPVIATGGVIKAFLERGFEGAKSMGAMQVVGYLQDPDWKGPTGKGPHDFMFIHSMVYYMQWTILSGVMNFAPQITPVSLSRYFQPHAKWSFPNMKQKLWEDVLTEIITLVGGQK
jgi:CO dehydrogenase/acetyl-CoA synthase complex epsilon subunit